MEKLLLLVDDEPYILKALQRLFHRSDYKVLTAKCGYQALDIIRDHPVAVLISDYNMPNITGAELLSVAKTLRPDMYTIVLSGNSDQDAVIQSINEGGASKFISKPWDENELHRVVDDAYANWSKQHYALDTPGLLKQASFVDALNTTLKGPYTHDYAIIYMQLADYQNVREVIGTGEERDLLNRILEQRSGESTQEAVMGLMDDGRLCVFLKIPESESHERCIAALLNSLPPSVTYNTHYFRTAFNSGYSVSAPSRRDANQLIKDALTAMHHATASGDSKAIKFKRAMQLKSTEQITLNNQLHQALENNEFSLYYQPKINLADQSLCGAEALLRWSNATLGSVSPDVFIPLAEHSPLINEIGDWVIRHAASQWVEVIPTESTTARVSVNVSPIQLQDPRFISRLVSALSVSGVNPTQLEIELTESTALHDLDSSLPLLRNIRDLGVKISIDDFGTGFSSLNYLSRLPVDIMKIDRSFVLPMHESTSNRQLVKNLINMGQDLGLEVVAEGVENAEQLATLAEFGCDVIQGFYYSRPLPLAEFIEFLSGYTPSQQAVPANAPFDGYRLTG